MKFYRWADTNAPGLFQTLSVYKCRGGFGGLLKCIEYLILRILLDVSQGSLTDLLPFQVLPTSLRGRGCLRRQGRAAGAHRSRVCCTRTRTMSCRHAYTFMTMMTPPYVLGMPYRMCFRLITCCSCGFCVLDSVVLLFFLSPSWRQSTVSYITTSPSFPSSMAVCVSGPLSHAAHNHGCLVNLDDR
ncbi:hypothetical protein GY45DRAFT_376823 [Cubamyces sp. BRFM 1775]|nr:hypothetical protein GY45DRAFT_376823 [Cubamyces sp. BRFM 1775]